MLPESPIDAIKAGRYLKVPVLAGNTRDEGKLFPTLLTLSPGLGGISGRLPTDAQAFSLAFGYDPNAAPQARLEQWIPAAYLPASKPGTGFTAHTDVLNAYWFIPQRDSVLGALRTQQEYIWYYRFDWDEEPAPFNDIFGAAHSFDLPFAFGNFGPSLWSTSCSPAPTGPGAWPCRTR